MSTNEYDEPLVGVTMMLADSAQVADGRLFILGGGVREIGPGAQPMAIAVLVDVPWDRANLSHEWRFELLDEDGGPVLFDDQPISVTGNFEAGRPAGLPAGTPICVPMAINFGALPITPGNRYEWRLAVNGTAEPEWTLPFRVRQLAAPAAG